MPVGVPLVSVVVPAYNAARFLPELCASLQAQTLADFEVLIGDDGSTDATREAIRPFLADPRFSYVRWDRNRGVNAATVDLLERVRGEFWAHPGADDVLMPEFLATRVQMMRSHPNAGLVHGMPLFIDEAGTELRGFESGVPSWSLGRPQFDRLPADDGCRVILQHNLINTPSVLVKTCVTRRILDLMRTAWRYAQDWAFWILHAANGAELLWDARVLSKYRVVQSSLSCSPRHAAVRRAEARLVPLCTLASTASKSDLAAQVWATWRCPLYHLWLCRAWAMRISGTLESQWLAMAAAAFRGHAVHRPPSLIVESLRSLVPLVRDVARERRVRRHQQFRVSGLAMIDHPFFMNRAWRSTVPDISRGADPPQPSG